MSRLGEPRDFESVWDEAVSSAQLTLASQWTPAVPPSPENWPGWSLTKVRMRKLWLRNAGSPGETIPRKRGHAKASGQLLPPLPWRERWLRHKTLSLAGRPDLVERNQGTVWVVDLKTGLQQAEPTDSQRTQLLFYCALVESALGELPSHAAIESTRGCRHSFVVEAQEVQNVVEHALTMLEQLNASGTQGISRALAAPSPTACGWCSFRPVCRPFFQAYDERWPISHALLFRIQAVAHGRHGYEVKAMVMLPRWRKNEMVHLLGFPFDTQPQPGEIWGAVDFAGRATSAVAAWNTASLRVA
jgi:hypothetical protein